MVSKSSLPLYEARRFIRHSVAYFAFGDATRLVKSSILVFCVLYFSAASLFAADKPKHNAMPREAGVVPNDATAIEIAVAVWKPIYGADNIARQKPFRATFAAGVWTVTGSLPKHMVGGVALAEISKTDGRILRISHGR